MVTHKGRRQAAAKRRVIAAPSPRAKRQHEHDYSALLTGVLTSFDYVARSSRHLFMTDAADLNDIYLDNLPEQRQVHDCSACRRFIETFGGLVHIAATGEQTPAMWRPDTVPEFYRASFEALHARVAKARVTSVHLSPLIKYGTPETGSWKHMAVPVPTAMIYTGQAITAGQAMAAARENFRTVTTALQEFTPDMLDQALRLFQGDHLARSEKFVMPVAWLRKLHDRPKGPLGHNQLWAAIAAAPEGFCHPKSSVIGPLLVDIANGLPFADIKRKFDAMIGPLVYQRPQAAPAAGNIRAAEALVEKLGIAPSLLRRFAKLEELELIWTPKAAKETGPGTGVGVFGHLKAKDAFTVPPVDLPATTMTWAKFSRDVLPNADRLELLAPYNGNYIAITAAVNPDAPPILKWDIAEQRNTCSVYVYHGGSPAQRWSVQAGWVEVTGLTPFPQLWHGPDNRHLGEGLVAVLKGCVDTNASSGSAIFPENLKAELHGIRPTIEAYSKSAPLAGREEATACGYALSKSDAKCTVRVFMAGAWSSYRIDRWD